MIRSYANATSPNSGSQIKSRIAAGWLLDGWWVAGGWMVEGRRMATGWRMDGSWMALDEHIAV